MTVRFAMSGAAPFAERRYRPGRGAEGVLCAECCTTARRVFRGGHPDEGSDR